MSDGAGEGCRLCPRQCGAKRTPEAGGGFCGMGTDPVIGRAALHRWEEPCISGTRGSGAVSGGMPSAVSRGESSL